MDSTISSASARQEFMNLLVTQLRNQDPLDPVSQEDYIGQLAQFSVLEGIESLNASFEQMLSLQQLTQGTELLGRNVQIQDPFTGELAEAAVEAVRVVDGQIRVSAGGREVGLDAIVAVVA